MTCWHCFREIQAEGPCPHCGFDPKGQREKYPLALRPGSVLLGRYTVGRVLGQGGFGITYIAQDFQTGDRVAVKEYLPTEFAGRGMDGNSVLVYSGERAENFAYGKEQFLAEAKTLAAFVGDEHIVRIYSYFEENGTAYFAMEYVDGPSLAHYMKEKKGRLSTAEAASLLLPLMESLGKVHAKGIVHRDIAPDNILIKNGAEAKLIDFGAARYSTGEKSQSLDVILKHGFAPYEQYMRRGRQGPWTDVYALAATFYFAVTGKVPPEAIERRDHDTLLAPSRLGADSSGAVDAVLQKALAVLSQDRYPSTQAFHDEMVQALAARPARKPAAKAARLPLILGAVAAAALAGFFLLRPHGSESPALTPEPAVVTETPAPEEEPLPEAQTPEEPAPEAPEVPSMTEAEAAEAMAAYRELFSGAAAGDTVTFGHYEQDNDITNGPEEIEWQVLDNSGDGILVISKYALDCQRYNNTRASMTWEDCSLRSWLNSAFLSEAFLPEEQALIPTVTALAGKNFSNGTSTGNDTEDQVFLLSIDETEKYFFFEKDRLCTPTLYARSQGCTTNSYSICWWWMRTTGEYSNTAAYVNSDGPIYKAGAHIETNNIGVRPALWIKYGTDASLYRETLNTLRQQVVTDDDAGVEISVEDTKAYYRDMLADAEIGDYLVFGSYEQDDDSSNGKEDLEWQVLDKDENRLFVISRYAVDFQQYHFENVPVTWETCSLRKWLNGTFVATAFTPGEQAMIPTVTVTASKHFLNGTSAGNSTEDKVFLLSLSEVSTYYPDYLDRGCTLTPYAEAKSTDRSELWWWTRSPGNYGYLATYIQSSTGGSFTITVDTRAAIRPTLWIDLSL